MHEKAMTVLKKLAGHSETPAMTVDRVESEMRALHAAARMNVSRIDRLLADIESLPENHSFRNSGLSGRLRDERRILLRQADEISRIVGLRD